MSRLIAVGFSLAVLLTLGCSLQPKPEQAETERRPQLRESSPKPGSAPRLSEYSDGGLRAGGGDAVGLRVLAPDLSNAPIARSGNNVAGSFSYDKTTERTLEGAILGTKTFPLADDSDGDGVIARVTENGEIPNVYLGPKDWLSRNQIQVNTNDKVTIIGSQVALNGQPLLMARQLTIGGKEYHLRDSAGSPYWPGPARH